MQYILAVLLRQQLLLDSHAHGVTHNFFVLRLPPGIDRAMERERIWPKLTRPEIKNELKEKALRFRRGGERDRHRHRAPHGEDERWEVENGVRYGSMRRARDGPGRVEGIGLFLMPRNFHFSPLFRCSATRAHPGRSRHPRESGQRHQPHLHHIVQPRAAGIRLLVSGE